MTVALAAAAAIAVLGFKSGGYFPAMWSWVSFALACVLLAAVALRSPTRWARRDLGLVVALAAVAGWTLLSAAWSVDPSQSVREAERALLYAAGVALVLAFVDSVFALTLSVFAAIAVVLTYGVGHYLFAAHPRPEGFEGFLLFRPVGYANAVGILAAMALLLALGIVTASGRRNLRCVAAAALVPLATALVLTSSRAAGLALVAGFVCMIALERERLRFVAVTVLLAAAPVLGAALSQRADLSNGTPFFRSVRAEHLGLELIGLTVAAAVVGLLAPIRYSRRTAAVLAGVACACAVAGAALVGATGSRPGYGGPRSQYWEVAWDEWRTRQLVGTGAGTFGRYWARQGVPQGAQDAHNLYLETLAELGPVGLALVIAALGIPLVGLRRARREPLAPALLGTYVAYLVHAGLDWDWEMPVVTLAALACGAGLLLAARDRHQPALAPRARIAALGLACALLAVSCVELVANDAITL